MRQSDVGIAYEESDNEEESGDADATENGTNGDAVSGDDDDDDDYEDINDDDDEMLVDEDAKDPRAGKVDVVLPQLQPNYEKLSGALFEAGSGKHVSRQNCDRLYRLSKQLKDLAAGAYPLAAELSEDEAKLPKRINLAKAAKKAAEEEIQMMLKIRCQC